tara:strand:- start:5748 stop:6089 length:342 start_codon:yes stop_codon:yes gene_type:complete
MIQNSIESVSQFVCTSSGIALAGVGVASQSDTSIISDGTLLPLSLFIGGIAFTAALTWRTSSAKSELQFRLKDIERRLTSIEKLSERSSGGMGMETRIENAESVLRDIKRRKR